MARKKLGNQILNNLQMSHANATIVFFKNKSEKKLQKEALCI